MTSASAYKTAKERNEAGLLVPYTSRLIHWYKQKIRDTAKVPADTVIRGMPRTALRAIGEAR
jgi:hypothetical protein